MKIHRGIIGSFVAASVLSIAGAPAPVVAQTMTMQERLSRYIDQRFGMFIHYNMNTYYGGWGENRVDPKTFAPPDGDCHTFTDQWAKAAKSAGMKFGLLTTKHHDGFALWPSKAVPPKSSPYGTTPYTIAQSKVPTMDVVKCYVDSFRAQGLDPNLYFSIWDPNNGIGSQSGHNTDPGAVDWATVGDYITTQLTELLTNYGPIPLIAFDGYEWLTGHQQVPYDKIRALVHRLQPDAIVLDHDGGTPWEVDTVYFEEPLGVRVPAGNTTPGSQGQTIAKNSNWFWDSGQASSGYMSASDVVNELKATEPNYTTFILDCPPNPQGMLDSGVVTVLGQIPTLWKPNTSRAPLPTQPPRILTPHTAVSATATSGSAGLAIDGYNDWSGGVNNTMHSSKGESLWKTTGALPQSITLDLGAAYSDVDMLAYLPQRQTGTTAGNITAYKILISTDGVTFTQVTSGTWPTNSTNNGLLSTQTAQWTRQAARYVRLEADAVAGGGTSVVAGEIAVGSSQESASGGIDGGTGDAGAGGMASGGASGSAGGAGGVGAGGAAGSGGKAGASGAGGGVATGGSAAAGGAGGSSGRGGNGGAANLGGTTGAAGAAGMTSSGGRPGMGGVHGGGGVSTGGSGNTSGSQSSGCGCAIAAHRSPPWVVVLSLFAVLAWRRRSKHRCPRQSRLGAVEAASRTL